MNIADSERHREREREGEMKRERERERESTSTGPRINDRRLTTGEASPDKYIPSGDPPSLANRAELSPT